MELLPSSTPQYSERHIRSLIQLLSDSDPRIAKTIHTRLVEVGMPALPYLTQAQSPETELTKRLREVIDEIQHHSIEVRFRQLSASTPVSIDLEEGAFLIAKMAYPELDIAGYQAQLTEMCRALTTRLTDSMSLREKIQAMNHYLFKEQEFKGNSSDYYDPDNTFLNRVLDRRCGIPIGLSVMYLLLGQRLGLPVRGVGMPGHFMVGLNTEEWFIDCFNGGTLLSQVECSRILRESGHGFELGYLNTSSNQQILIRMLRNLVTIYQSREETIQAQRCQQVIEILEGFTTT